MLGGGLGCYTTSSLFNGNLGEIIEEDGRFKPRSVDLLGDKKVIYSKNLKLWMLGKKMAALGPGMTRVKEGSRRV